MGYQALYRRFRPKMFDEVLGQEHITTILKNVIKNDNIAHAYLFSGTRGTGKTSTAKIFARAVNCSNNIDGNPCNACDTCEGILDNSIMDVVEMDAASNNSVDDIRELKEKVKYLPSKGKYKVYIIDEVHMLSKGAFNALLKTLEEPPKHLIFILATTEPQKLPATILSRCQRFDFKRIRVKELVYNMKLICNEININIDEDALHLIARNSDGAMRDALSMLDQCVSFGDKEITYESVLSILGIVNNDIVFEIVDYIIDKNVDKTLELLDYIVQNGKDIHQFILDLINHFRDIMIIKVSKESAGIIDGTVETIKRYKEQSEKIKTMDITRIINILSEAENGSKRSTQPRIVLEISLIKIVSPSIDYSIDSLMNRIEVLEDAIKNGLSIKTVNNENISRKEHIEYTKKDNTKVNKEEKNSITIENNEIINKIENNNGNVDFGSIIKAWPDILKSIKKAKISLHALLSEGQPVSYENNTIIISFKDGFSFHKEAVDKTDNKEFLEKSISSYLGLNINMKLVMEDEISNTKIDKKDENEALINKTKEIFGEDLLEIID